LQAHTGCTRGAAIHLKKRIPWAAGLGGGSADAAATLVGLNDLWNLNVPRAELLALAADLGSDVPFFLGPTSAAWCTGRGEIITPVSMTRAWDMLLVQGPEGIRTADVFRRVQVPAQPQSDARIRAALAAQDLNALGRSVYNRLQGPAFALAPTTATLFAHLQSRGAAGCFMSGSGSCLVALVDSASEAQRIADDLLSGSAPEVPPGTRTYIVQSCIDTMPTA
jgi:4-diphosphocytidyl-2-C-methyl-D-erythritol kinase